MTKFLLLIIISIHGIILTKLILFPYPELFVYPYLTNQGFVPYKQILDQHFPGLMFFPINLGTLGMTTPEVARLWLIGMVAITHFLIFLIGRDIFKSTKLALLGNLLYLIWQPFFEGYVLWIDTFLPLFLLPAFYFLWKWTQNLENKNLLLAGLFLGIALIFKQVVLPLVVLVAIFIWLKTKKLAPVLWFGLGVAPPLLLTFAYFAYLGVLRDFWYWTVTFNLTIFAQYGRKLPELSHLVRAGFVFGIALLLWFLSVRKHSLLFMAGLFMLASFAATATRFDFIHLQPALPFALLMTAGSWPLVSRARLGKVGITIYLIVIFVWLPIFYKGHLGDKIFFFDEQMQQVATKTQQLSDSGDSIFVFGIHPHLYQMTQTLPPGRVFVFQFPWFMKVAQNRVLNGLERDPPKIVLIDRTAQVDNQRMVDYMSDIVTWIDARYETIEKIGTVEFMLPKGAKFASR